MLLRRAGRCLPSLVCGSGAEENQARDAAAEDRPRDAERRFAGGGAQRRLKAHDRGYHRPAALGRDAPEHLATKGAAMSAAGRRRRGAGLLFKVSSSGADDHPPRSKGGAAYAAAAAAVAMICKAAMRG